MTQPVLPPADDAPSVPTASDAAGPVAPESAKKRRRMNSSLVRGLLSNRKSLAGICILIVFTLVALLAPVIFPGDPNAYTDDASLAPSLQHPLGTTARGQDVLALTAWGARSSMFVGVVVGIIATIVGIGVGLASAYFGGILDEAFSLVTNVFLLVPGLPLLVVLAAYLPPGLGTIIFVLTVTGWAGSARVLRSQALSLRGKDYVAAAIVTGERSGRIMVREMMPNMASIVMNTFMGTTVGAIGAQAGLEFLGLGDLSVVSWGTNLFWANNEGSLMTGSWWVFAPSGICIALVAFAFSLINYAVDEVTNARLRTESMRDRRVIVREGHESAAHVEGEPA